MKKFILLLTTQCILSFSIYPDKVDIFEALDYEKLEDLKEAINQGANVNQIDSNREMTALMRAISSMKPELVQLLISKKANVHAKIPESGKTALMFFMEQYAMESEQNDTETIYKENLQMLEIFEALIKAGAKVNDKDNEGKSVLAYAVESTYSAQSEKILKTLLSLKADPNIPFNKNTKNSICRTVLEDSTGYQKVPLKLFYSTKACDPNQVFSDRNSRFTNPLYIALEKLDKESVQMLLMAGADPNKGASDTMMDYVPLFVCISDFEITELLLKAKTSPNSIENKSHILEHAARNVPDDEQGEKIIDLLLKFGAEINHPALFDSYSPYNKAFYAAHIVGKTQIEKYLEKRGALRSDQLKKQERKSKKTSVSKSKEVN